MCKQNRRDDSKLNGISLLQSCVGLMRIKFAIPSFPHTTCCMPF